MGNATSKSVLDRLRGKKVVFQGRFGYGEQERLQAMAEAQQGVIVETLDAAVDYLVLPDLSAGKTVQKKAQSLNAKGASVQVVDQAAFNALVEATDAEVLALIRGGKGGAPILSKALAMEHLVMVPAYVSGVAGMAAMGGVTLGQGGRTFAYAGEFLANLDLTAFQLTQVSFDQCKFTGCVLSDASFNSAKACDFSRTTGGAATFADATGSRFIDAQLPKAALGVFAHCDFSGAALEGAIFSLVAGRAYNIHRGVKAGLAAGCVFTKCNLRSAQFQGSNLQAPNFQGADLRNATFSICSLDAANFRGANLQDASLLNCKLPRADLSGADLRRANLAGADLTGACLDNADLAGCNLRGANLAGVELSKARNYQPTAVATGSVGPALTELDQLVQKARRIAVSFRIQDGKTDDGEEVSINSTHLKYGWGLRLPPSCGNQFYQQSGGMTFSDAVLQAANILGHRQVRFGTIEVESTKSPKGGKELRDLAITGISEGFAQAIPPAEELAAATKTWREQMREQSQADRERRQEAKKKAEQAKTSEKKQVAKIIAKQVGKVTDTATFLKALELRIERPKIDKATKMLKASGFQLFNDVTDTHLNGVVKSQTDPDLVYACRIQADGHYACCTQNLNICGGLRGSICKHLLVLIIGLVQAGELDPTIIDSWVATTHDIKPELDKETMGDIFIRYKGAEAGEVDWRPTQTVPEDYYTL